MPGRLMMSARGLTAAGAAAYNKRRLLKAQKLFIAGTGDMCVGSCIRQIPSLRDL